MMQANLYKNYNLIYLDIFFAFLLSQDHSQMEINNQ